MAKINGVELKNIKSFAGMEGTVQQGNIYMDGKKVGFFSQDSHGGPSYVDAEKPLYAELEKRSDRYFTAYPPNLGPNASAEFIKNCSDLPSMFEELLELCNFEKDYKKAVKKGYKGIVYVEQSFFHEGPCARPEEYMYPTKEMAMGLLADKIANDDWEVKLFFSPSDFEINC